MHRTKSLWTTPARLAPLAPLALACAALLWGSAQAAGPAQSASPVLLQGQGITITAQDLQGEALRIPPQQRAQLLAHPAMLRQFVGGLYIQRAMAQQARQQGLQRQPDVAAALQLAQEKVLSEVLMAQQDEQARPSAEAAQAQAHSIYLAQPERFLARGEEVHASHILISGKGDEHRAKAQALLHRLQQGADFAELARQESADLSNAAKGGDLGFFAKGRMVPEFEEAAFALQNPGDLSPVVETGFGLHIIRLQERRPAGQKPFEEVRDGLVEEVQELAVQNARTLTAEKIRAQAQFNDEALQALAAQYDTQARQRSKAQAAD